MADTNILSILILAKDEASKVLREAGISAEESSGKFSNFAGVAKTVGLMAIPIAVVGAATVKMAADFQSSMVRLVTSAGESKSNLASVSAGVLALARETGTTTEELGKAMYTIESGGQHGAAGLLVLKAAAQGAKAENSDLKTVADAVTSVLVDYHLKAEDAALVTTKLVAATSAGKTTFQELAGAMPDILPVASAAHVALSDILGDLAAMTIHGMSAQQSAQNLADVIRHMQNPTSVQAKELALLNMTTTQLAGDLQSKGLSGTLQEISTHIQNLMPPGSDKVILNLKTTLNGLSPSVRALGLELFNGTMTAKDYGKAASALDPISAKQAMSFATLAGTTHRIGDAQMSGADVMQNYGQALAKATGDATGLNVALMLSGENAGVANTAIKTVSDATNEAGGNVKGWSEVQSTFNARFAQFKEILATGAITIGTTLLPVLTHLLTVVDDTGTHLSGVRTVFRLLGDTLTGSDPTIKASENRFAGLSSVLSEVQYWVLTAVSSIHGLWTAFANSTAVTVITQYFQQVFVPALSAIGAAVVQNLLPALGQLWDALVRLWQAMSPGLVDALKVVGVIMGGLLLAAVWLIVSAINVFVQILAGVVSAISNVIEWTSNLISWFGNLVGVVVNTGGSIITIFRNLLPALRDVGLVMVDIIASPFEWAYNKIVGIFRGLPGEIGTIVKGAFGSVGSAVSGTLHTLHIPGFALGTNYATGGIARVGENGPENVILPQGAQVIPNGQSKQMGATSSITNVLSGTFNFQNADASNAFWDRLDKTQRLAKLGMA